MKHRFVGFALALALLASAGMTSMVSAEIPPAVNTVTVTASVSDVLTLTIDTPAIDFGSNLTFLGTGAGAGIYPCTDTNATGLTNGTRFLAPHVGVTIQSTTNYDYGRAIFDPITPNLASRFWFNSAGWDCTKAETSIAAFTPDVTGPGDVPPSAPYLGYDMGSGTSGILSFSEYYALDVSASDPSGGISFTVIYAAVAQP